MSGNPSEAAQAFTEAFREGGSAQERRQNLEESEDYDTGNGGNGSTDNGDDDRATPEAGSDRGLQNAADEVAGRDDGGSNTGNGGGGGGDPVREPAGLQSGRVGEASESGGSGSQSSGADSGGSGGGNGSANGRATPEAGSDRGLENLADEAASDSGGGSDPVREPAGLQSGRVGGFEGGSYDDSSGGGIADPEPDPPQSGQGIGPRGVGDPSAAPADELDAPDREFNPESTQTGAAEARDDEIGEQARQLEQELAGRQISSLSDDLKMSGAQLREEDIAVEVRGEGENRRLEATLSDVGQERVEFIAEGQQQQAAERAVEKELNRPFASSDVTVTDDGEVEVSQRVEDEAARQQLADETPFRERDIRVDDGQASLTESGRDRVRNERRQEAASELEDELGLEQGDDFTVRREVSSRRVPTERGQGDLEINLTESGQQKLQGRELADESPIASDLIEEGAQQRDTETGEAFGGRGALEQRLRGWSGAFQSRVVDPAADVSGDIGALSPAAILSRGAVDSTDRLDDLLQAPAQEDSGGEFEEFSEGTASGAGAIVDVPGLGVSAIELGETGVGTVETAADDGAGQAAGDLAAAGAISGAEFGAAAARNPARVGGQLAGSTIGSSAILRGASRVGGPRTTKAAATAIQPGEELAISLAKRGAVRTGLATKVPGVRKQQIIPESKGGSGDPLVDIEIEGSGSTAIESTDFRSSGDSGRLSAAGDRVSANVRSFVGDERGQLGGGRQRTRQRQRQRQQQQQEPVIEIDVENDPLVRARQRTESAQESRVESDIETRVRADTRLRSAQRLEAATMQDAAQTPAVGLSDAVGVGLGTEQFAGVDAITEPAGALDTRTEPIAETRTETGVRQDTRAETRQEARQDLATETAVETRAETRTDLRSELRTEADGEDLLEEETLEGLSPTDGETATRRFGYGVASPDEVLSGEVGIADDVDAL